MERNIVNWQYMFKLIDGLEQNCSNSSALAIDLLQFYAKLLVMS